MVKVVYNSLSIYFNALAKLGHVSYDQVERLLVLVFIRHILYEDYRGMVGRKDYKAFEEALSNLYGSTCLIPFTDYSRMGRLHLGEMRELVARVRNAELRTVETEKHLDINDSVTESIAIRMSDAELDITGLENRVTVIDEINADQDSTLAAHAGRITAAEQNIVSLQQEASDLADADTRIRNRVAAVETRLDNDEDAILANAESIKENRQRIENLEDKT